MTNHPDAIDILALCSRIESDLGYPWLASNPDAQQKANEDKCRVLSQRHAITGFELMALVDVVKHAAGVHYTYSNKHNSGSKKAALQRLFSVLNLS